MIQTILQPWIILSSLVSTIIYLSGALVNGTFDLKLWAESWRFGCGIAIIIAWTVIFFGVILWAVGEEFLNSKNKDED